MRRRTVALTCLNRPSRNCRGHTRDARDVVEIRLHGRYFIGPPRPHVVAVNRMPERALLIEADGDQMYRSSELALSGANDKRLHSIEFRNLPAGAYTLRAQ